METATISVQALKKRNSPEFLARLAGHELTENPPDALIFLGPKTETASGHGSDFLPKGFEHTPVFYLQYIAWYGANFNDTVQTITKDLDGKIYTVHSPAQFSQAIQKILVQLKQE